MKVKIIAATIFIAFCACNDSGLWTEEDEKFAITYSAILFEREKVNDSTIIEHKIDSILQRVGLTESSFRAKFDYYSKDPKLLHRLIDSTQAIAQRSLQKVKSRK